MTGAGGLWGAVLALTAGALAQLLAPTLWPASVWVGGLPLAGFLGWLGTRNRVPGALWPLLALLGAGWGNLHAARALAHRWPLANYNASVTWRVAVLSPPKVVEGQGAFKPRPSKDGAPPPPDRTLLFEAAPLDDGAGAPPDAATRPRKLAAAWYRTPAEVKGGECWLLTMALKAPHGTASPGALDGEKQAVVNGLDARATVKGGLPCGPAPGLRAWLARARQAGGDAVSAALPNHPRGATYIRALLFALDDGFSGADWTVFRATGTTHLVVVSGGNIAIASGLFFFLGRWLWGLVPGLALRMPAFKAGSATALLGALGQTALAGFDPPVSRALAAVAALWLAGLAGRRIGFGRALLLAWGALVIVDPLALLGASIWLSFGACAAIAWWAGGRLPAPRAGLWGWRSNLKQLVYLQLGISLVMAPLTMYFFQGVSAPGLVVNLFAVPLFGLMTPLVLVATAALPVSGWPLVGCAWVFERFHAGLAWLAGAWPGAWVSWSASAPVLAAWLAGVLLLTLPRGIPLRGAGLALVLAGVAGGVRPPVPLGQAWIDVLDVGQGLSVVVRTRAHALVFDAGPGPGDEGLAAGVEGYDAGAAVVVPALHALGVSRLDTLVVSHPDLDHAGGAPSVLAAFPGAKRVGSGGTPCREGDEWAWDGVGFAFLNPGPGTDMRDDNESGCVLVLRAGDHAALLPADIEKKSEARLVDAYGPTGNLHADLLIAAHHGSLTSSTQPFVEAVNPDLVVYAAGWRNKFHHPRPEVVLRYMALGTQARMTGHHGTKVLENF